MNETKTKTQGFVKTLVYAHFSELYNNTKPLVGHTCTGIFYLKAQIHFCKSSVQ